MVLGSAALLLPLAESLGQRSGVAARYLLAMAATAVATPVQAQTEITLVSNSGQVAEDAPIANRSAQAFTTGANASGYTLTSITLHGANVWEASKSNTATLHSGSRTGTQVTGFTAMVSGGTLVLTPTSTTTLTQETTYYLVTANDFGTGIWLTTVFNDEDSGAAAGWSIADDSELFQTGTMAWVTITTSRKITVKGYANTPPNNAPTVENEIPDQTAMEGQAFSFTLPDTTFADSDTDDTLTYSATLDDDSALPTWLSFDDTTRSFSGTPGSGDGGTITVRVTANDGTDTVHDDFEIKVATVCAEPNFGARRRIWTGTVTVGDFYQDQLDGYQENPFEQDVDSALSPRDVEIGANRYTVDRVTVGRFAELEGNLTFSLEDPPRPDLSATEKTALQLHVCNNTPYAFSTATESSLLNSYEWDLDLDWSGESTRTLYLSLPANNAATGLPTITSSDGATVGDTLSANQGAIADADGLPATFPDDYTLQWVREDEDGMNGEDISGETSSTYTLTADDVGRKVRVRVSFIDQLSGMETVTSDGYPASGTVVPIPPTVTISGPSSAVEEGNDLMFTLTLDVAAPTDLTVNLTVAETEDVVAATDEGARTVTVMEGETQATFTVATRNDDVDETDSVVTVEVAADSDTPAMYQVGSPSEATVTVTDDDEREVTVSGSPLTMNEGGTGAYTVVLTSQPTNDVTITPSSDNTDVTFTPATLTFTVANWNTVQTVSVMAMPDTDNADDTATITHTATGADYQGITVASVTVTVSENVLPSVTIAADNSSVTEGTAAAFTLTRTGDDTTNALTVNVTVTENGGVISGSAPTSVTFNVGETTAALSVVTDDDDVDEDAGMVMVMLAGVVPATYVLGDPATATATVTVEDNDARPVVTLSRSPDTITEAAGMSEIRAMLSNPSAVETLVTVSVPADVLGAVELDVNPPVLVIPAGMTSSANVVTLTAVDNDVEASEDLSVTVSGMAVNTVGVTGPAPVTLTITDDDDTTAPRVTITNVPPRSSAPFTATITFNEVVSGFMVDNITAGNATLSAFTESTTTPGRVWTVLVTPMADGVVTLTIAAGVATDEAGNGNMAAPPASSTYTAALVNDEPSSMIPDRDTTAPRVAAIERQTPDASPTNGDGLTWRVTFSEAVMNVNVADFTVSGSTATVTTVEPVGGETGVYDVTVSGGDLASFNGTVTLGFASGRNIQDENGNALSTTVPTGANHNSYEVDNAAPLVTITDVPATSTAPFTATISFNEVVRGFTVDDITVVNATLSPLTETTPGTVWTVLVTPMADGRVTLTIPANVTEDIAGNGNLAAAHGRSTHGEAAMEIEAKEKTEAVLEDVVLPDMMQQLTGEITEVITSRLNTTASGSPPSTLLTLSLEDVVADTVAAFHGQREHLKNGSLDWWQALSGRNLVLPLSNLNVAQGDADAISGENPFSTLALWGGGNYSSYRNIIADTDVDGNGFSGTIGIDLQPIPQLTTGLALTTSRWGLDYATEASGASAEGTYEIGITMVNPYVTWWATEQLSLWATVGYGRGEVKQNPDGGGAATRTDGLTSWAGGVRFEVVPAMDPATGEGAPFGLAFKGDGATSSFLDTSVQLARLAAEVSRSFTVEGGLLSAALDLGWSIRSVSDTDDRDGQQQAITEKNDGGGAEVAGRLNWQSTDGSLSATVDTRVLLGGGDHREWGIGGHLRLTPSRRNGEGLSFTLQPSFGVTGTRLDELWSLSGNSDLAINNHLPGARLDAQLAYGFRPLGNALLTPYTEVVWAEAANTYGAGLRYHLNPSLELDLKGARRSGTNGNREHRFSLDLYSHL